MKENGFKPDEYSFVVYMYDGMRAVLDREPVSVKYNFPSVRSAVAYMDYFYPTLYYYDIELTNEKVDCPFPFRQIL